MSDTAPLFLDKEEMRTLTGRASKRLQIDALKQMGISFYVNAAGRPVVVRAVLEGKAESQDAPKLTWSPRLAKKEP